VAGVLSSEGLCTSGAVHFSGHGAGSFARHTGEELPQRAISIPQKVMRKLLCQTAAAGEPFSGFWLVPSMTTSKPTKLAWRI
jgi:hypothetical protein